MTIRVIRTTEELQELSGIWDELLATSHSKSVFLSWRWVSSWTKSYLGKNKLLCLVVYDGEKPIAIAPLWVKRMRFGKLFTFKVLRMLVSERVGADHLDLIVSSSNRMAVIDLIWDELFGNLRKEWDIFSFDDIPTDSRTMDRMRWLSEEDYRCIKTEFKGYAVCPYLPLPSTYDDFLDGLSRKHRYSINRYKRLLSEQAELRFECAANQEELDAAMELLIALNRKSWRERGQEGSFGTQAFIDCHRDLARGLLDEGRLMLCSLFLGERHIGSFYGFFDDGTLYNYIMSVERGVDRRVSIGKVLLAMCIEKAIGRGCSELDFLRGDEEYKYEWTDRDRRNLSMEFYNRKFRALLYILYVFTKKYAKQLGKAVLGRHSVTVNEWRNGAIAQQENGED